jgi:crotonobetainyl-CoA:carnitine CoA-transferase CaiB-like acyl-CoA transferase
MSKLPLSRFKVVDLTRVRAGPTCARQLADWGADVIKVESVGGDDGLGGGRESPDFQNLHRNKRSVAINLKSPQGIEILKRLTADADVLVENYRPDVKYRLGIDYETMKAVNPRLIYASISGFGETGPYRDRPGFDQIAQGMGGLMWITGLPGQGPVRAGIPIADLTAGIFAAMGVLIALLEREESGEGQWVQSSLLAAQTAMLDFQAARWLIGKEVPPQAGNNHPTGIPTGVFKTKDGAINIASAGQAIYSRLCKALEAPHLATDPQFLKAADRLKNRDKLNALIEEVTLRKTSAEWIELLNEAGVPSGPIYKMDEVFADPQVKHLGMARRVVSKRRGPMEVVGQAISLSRTPWQLRTATPEHGEHTDAILAEVGYTATEIAGLRQEGIVS